jgi:hypothetical protein
MQAMNYYNAEKYGLVLFGIILLISGLESGVGAQERRCNQKEKDEVNLNLVAVHKNHLPPHIRSARVVVSAEDFNVEYMRRLARTLRNHFCNDDEISVTIFDQKIAARNTDLGAYLAGRIVVPELRGFYSYSHTSKAESIQFSMKRGNPNHEIVLPFP